MKKRTKDLLTVIVCLLIFVILGFYNINEYLTIEHKSLFEIIDIF